MGAERMQDLAKVAMPQRPSGGNPPVAALQEGPGPLSAEVRCCTSELDLLLKLQII